ncbi:MAG: hydrolase [Candidatus Marsarchaeota archaeon]|jgi:nicotinamidase-related amidase|nr:hydrolase [Candidatus Marsarchaeota archaeon]MCL5111978.1 hydrolase [Candidatus Marsarchaeota archaeon]
MGLDIDKKSAALVVIDLQRGIASADRQLAPHSAREVIDNAARIADAFRRAGMPVFLVHVMSSGPDRLNVIADDQGWGNAQMPKDWADLVPELGPKEGDIIITKRQWGAFYGTDLELQLRRRGISTIVLCGVSTNHGVESTARFAYEYGFNQVFVEDAMSSMSADMHNAAISIALKRIGRVRSTDEVLAALR